MNKSWAFSLHFSGLLIARRWHSVLWEPYKKDNWKLTQMSLRKLGTVGYMMSGRFVRSECSVIMLCFHVKVKCSYYRPSVAWRVGRGIALLLRDHGTRRGWVVSSKPQLHFTPGKDLVPNVQEAGWAPGPVWMGGKILSPWGFDPGPPSP